MGRSARRLNSTRSGIVSARLLGAGIGRLSLAAPIPPLASFERQLRIPSLSHRSAKNIKAANILRLPGNEAQAFIELLGTAARQLLHAAHSQQFEVAQESRPDRNEIFQAALRDSRLGLV